MGISRLSLAYTSRLRRGIGVLFISALFFISSQLRCTVHAQKAECVQVAQLYQSALREYQTSAQRYLKAGCQETTTGNERCKALEAATREMLSTVEMFSLRARALKCKVTDAQETPQTKCDRLISLAKRSREELNVLRDQQRVQRCADRPYAPSCKALLEASKRPREVVKAVRRQALKAGCEIPD